MQATRLSENLLLVTGDYGQEHMTVVRTADGLVVIDTLATLPATRTALPLLTAFSPEPVRLVVNTHADMDHVAGNSLFPGATIIGHVHCPHRWSATDRTAHESMRGLLAYLRSLPTPADPRLAARHTAYLHDFGSLEPGFDDLVSTPPFVLVPGGTRITLGGTTLDLDYMGPGHSDADLVIRIPSEDVIVAGDLVMGEGIIPVAHAASGGSLEGLRRAVDHIDAWSGSKTRIVPGHGQVGGVEMLLPQRAYLDGLLSAAMAERATGAESSGMTDFDLEPFRCHYLYDLFHPRHVTLARAEVTRALGLTHQ